MKRNILHSIRNSKTLSFFMIGLLSNFVVFAEPVAQAVYNRSVKQDRAIGYFHAAHIPAPEMPKNETIPSFPDDPEFKKSPSPQSPPSFIRINAARNSGKIGVSIEGINDRIHDNFFNFFIPDSIDLSNHQTILTYELYGLSSEEGTTKSINGSKAYGGKTIEKDQEWKKVEEYLPPSLLKNGNNEIFFNRYTDRIYEYEIKNFSLKLYAQADETVIQSKLKHNRIFNSEQSLESTIINLQEAVDDSLSFYGLSLKPEKRPETETRIEISGLPFKDVKPLDQDLLNVTAGDFPAYRIRAKDSVSDLVEIFLAYDFRAIPEGYSTKDIRTYVFDKVHKSWKALPVARIDLENEQIVSLISDPLEGNDYINGIIKVPEQPETTNFTPTTLKDIEFANPAAGVVSIPPPVANNNGTVNTSFPIKLPPGRNGMQPSLEVSYNSEGGNDWMGIGWNLDIPALSLNTKWGVPLFNPNVESEMYSLHGQDLVFESEGNFTAPHRDIEKKRLAERTFYLRKEGSYLQIIRHGNSPSNYWWEVTDKSGNKSFYGGLSGVSQDHVLRNTQGSSGNIVHWALIRQEDPYGNYIEYNYDKQWKTLQGGISGWTFEIKNIKYTLHPLESHNYYQIDFIKNPNRNDVITSARTGVIRITDHLLDNINISFKEGARTEKIRSYHFEYSDAAFRKKHLTKISEYDSEDRLFYTNTLEYFEAAENGIISDVVEDWSGSNDDISSTLQKIATGSLSGLIPSGSALGTNVSSGFSFGMRVGVGLGTDYGSVGNTIGGSYNYQSSNQEARISFIDINGDGLPDKIYTNSSRVYYRPNTGSGFGNRIQIDGINNLDKTKSRTNGFGVDANLFGYIGIGKSTSKTKSMTDHYFIDRNGGWFAGYGQ